MTRARDVASQGGLVLISSTTVGTAVSSVIVSNCFSATYENYRVTYSGGSASVGGDRIDFKGSGTTGTPIVYAGRSMLNDGTSGTINTLGNSIFNAGRTATNNFTLQIDVFNPFATATTGFAARSGGTNLSTFVTADTSTSGTDTQTNSSTGFTLNPGSGTFTGGTIRVYGYRN